MFHFFTFFLALVLLEEAAVALGLVDTLALGVVDAVATLDVVDAAAALGVAAALEDATSAATLEDAVGAALALAFLAAVALEDASGIALVASASTIEVNAVVGCTVEPPTLP